MVPILLTTPFFVLRTISFFAVIAYLISMFFYWRKGREEHYDEATMLDGFLLSSLVGVVVGRLSFILLHFSSFSSVVSWVDIWNHPGGLLELGIVAAGLYLARFARNQKWDVYELLDIWAIAVAAGLAVIHLAFFLDGSQFGTATSLPWGVVFAGLLEPHHPLQLYNFFFFIGLLWYLSWVELRYRTFEWYRAGKKNAQTGFLVAMLLLLTGLFKLILYPITTLDSVIGGMSFDFFFSLASLVCGVAILLYRSGKLHSQKSKR